MQQIQSDFSFFFSSLAYCGYDIVVFNDKTGFKVATDTGEIWFHFNEQGNLDLIECFPAELVDVKT